MKHLAEAIVYRSRISGAIREAALQAARKTRNNEEREFFKGFLEAFNVGGSEEESE